MTRICHAHCPDSSGGLLAVLGLAVAVVLAVIVGRAVASVFVGLMVTGGVLGTAGIAHLAYVLRRNRWSATDPRELPTARVVARALPQRSAQAVSASRRPAIEAPRPQLSPTATIRIQAGGNPAPSSPRHQ